MVLFFRHVALHGLEAIYRNGEIVGYIRRAEFAFALDKVIAWGYIRNPSGEPIKKDFIESGEIIEYIPDIKLTSNSIGKF